MPKLKRVTGLNSILFSALLGMSVMAPLDASMIDGNLAVYSGNTLIGYVSATYDGQNSFTYTTTIADALTVSLDPSATLFDLTVVDPPGLAINANFGAVGGMSYQFGSGNSDFAYLSGSSFTAADSIPSFAASNDIQAMGYNGPSESTIWTRIGDVLIPFWVNADSTIASNQVVYYDPVVDYLGITGDLTAFNNNFGENAQAVTLEFTGMLPTPEPATYLLLGAAVTILGVAQGLRHIRRRR